MEYSIPEVYLKIAELQEGERIASLSGHVGGEYDLEMLGHRIQSNFTAGCKVQVQALRCGWIEEPVPNKTEGVREHSLGLLWVVYTQTGAGDALDEGERERGKTEELRKKVIQLLQHDTSTTRWNFAEVLRRQVEQIEAELVNE